MNKIIPGILETKWEDIEKKIETIDLLPWQKVLQEIGL